MSIGRKKKKGEAPEVVVADVDEDGEEQQQEEGEVIIRQSDPLKGKVRETLPHEMLQKAMLW